MRRAEGVFRVKNHDFTPTNHIFSNFRGCAPPPSPPPPWIRPCILQTAEDTAIYVILVIWEWVWVTLLAMQYMKRCIILRSEIMNKVGGTDPQLHTPTNTLAKCPPPPPFENIVSSERYIVHMQMLHECCYI